LVGIKPHPARAIKPVFSNFGAATPTAVVAVNVLALAGVNVTEITPALVW